MRFKLTKDKQRHVTTITCKSSTQSGTKANDSPEKYVFV